MFKTHVVQKGMTLPIMGSPSDLLGTLESTTTFAITPDSYLGLVPKLAVKEGDKVLAGDSILFHKKDDRIRITSPVSGVVTSIVRGAKRRLEHVLIEADAVQAYASFPKGHPANRDEVIERLTASGLWTMLEMRPYGIIANPNDQPKAVFINAMATAPFAPEASITLKGREMDFQSGIKVLSLLASKTVLSIAEDESSTALVGAENVEIHRFQGQHPAGNTSVHIAHVSPLNKGEVVWAIDAQDVAILGQFFRLGEVRLERVITMGGTGFVNPSYVKAMPCMRLTSAMDEALRVDRTYRVISGSVLTGQAVGKDGFLSYNANQLTAIPEGEGTEFFGWVLPNIRKFSKNRTFISWMFPHRKYDLSTKMNGEDRNFVMTGEYGRVFPFDILPNQLLKAMWANDLESMEALGAYEVVEEDFALCEVICTSKQPLQSLVRSALDMLHAEMN